MAEFCQIFSTAGILQKKRVALFTNASYCNGDEKNKLKTELLYDPKITETKGEKDRAIWDNVKDEINYSSFCFIQSGFSCQN